MKNTRFVQKLYLERWAGLVLLCGFVVFMVLLPPYLDFSWRFVLMESFSAICHQLPQRSFHIHDVSLAVCHRCFGIYVGLLIGVLVLTAFPGSILNKRILLIATLIAFGVMSIDWVLPLAGLGNNSIGSRFATGLLFGILGGGLLGQAIVLKEKVAITVPIDIRERNFV